MRILANSHNAAANDHVETQSLCPGDELGAFRAWIQPDLPDRFACYLFNDLESHFRRNIEADAIESGRGDIENGRISPETFNHSRTRMDGIDVEPLACVGTDGAVAVLAAVGAGADDCNRLFKDVFSRKNCSCACLQQKTPFSAASLSSQQARGLERAAHEAYRLGDS